MDDKEIEEMQKKIDEMKQIIEKKKRYEDLLNEKKVLETQIKEMNQSTIKKKAKKFMQNLVRNVFESGKSLISNTSNKNKLNSKFGLSFDENKDEKSNSGLFIDLDNKGKEKKGPKNMWGF